MCEYFFCRQKNNNKKAGTFLHIFSQLDLLFNLHLSVLAHKTFFCRTNRVRTAFYIDMGQANIGKGQLFHIIINMTKEKRQKLVFNLKHRHRPQRSSICVSVGDPIKILCKSEMEFKKQTVSTQTRHSNCSQPIQLNEYSII